MDFLEFFAGHSNLTRSARRSGRVSARFDIKFGKKGSFMRIKRRGLKKRSNYMDLLTPSGFLFLVFIGAYMKMHKSFLWIELASTCPTFSFEDTSKESSTLATLRTAIVFILKGKPGFAAWFAIKCSSFVAVNAGTSARTACSPVGFLGHASVRIANCLLERTDVHQHLQSVMRCLERSQNLCTYAHIVMQDYLPHNAGTSLRWSMDIRTTRKFNSWILSCMVGADDWSLQLVRQQSYFFFV